MTNWIAASAAVAAAIFSIVNVFLSNKFSQNSQVAQWRRDSVLKTMTEFLETSRELREVYGNLAKLRDYKSGVIRGFEESEVDVEIGIERAYQVSDDARRKLQSLLAELELVASIECVSAGRALYELLDQPIRMGLRSGGPEEKQEFLSTQERGLNVAHDEFVQASRVDLGIE